ncbi:MAG: zinc ribbon domain-containing protein [Christensenellaceae bacterium]|jgi:hypothetical protein|nr:zinc ribbon domain-containing protein [Christensenellaceae bacterium]
MKCGNCNSRLKQSDKFCSNCGAVNPHCQQGTSSNQSQGSLRPQPRDMSTIPERQSSFGMDRTPTNLNQSKNAAEQPQDRRSYNYNRVRGEKYILPFSIIELVIALLSVIFPNILLCFVATMYGVFFTYGSVRQIIRKRTKKAVIPLLISLVALTLALCSTIPYCVKVVIPFLENFPPFHSPW